MESTWTSPQAMWLALGPHFCEMSSAWQASENTDSHRYRQKNHSSNQKQHTEGPPEFKDMQKSYSEVGVGEQLGDTQRELPAMWQWGQWATQIQLLTH